MVESNSVTIAGPANAVAGVQLRAVVDLRRQPLALEDDLVLVHTAPDASGAAGVAVGQLGLRHGRRSRPRAG